MKKPYALIVICATVLALVAVPATVSAQDKLSEVGIQLTPSRLTSSIGPSGGAELKQTAASTEVLATVYPDRATFDAAFPGLPIEDWEDFTDTGIIGCDAPANDGTSCVGGYDVGDILPGLEIDCALNSGPAGNGLVIVPPGFNGNDTIEFGSNTFDDNTIINFDPPVDAVGFDISCHFGSPSVDILVYDGIGGLIWAGNYSPCDPTGAFVGWSADVPDGIGRIELNDPSGASTEHIDDVAFGDVVTMFEIPGMGTPAIEFDFDLMPQGATTVAAITAQFPNSVVDTMFFSPCTVSTPGVYNTDPDGRALSANPDLSLGLYLVDPPTGDFGCFDDFSVVFSAPISRFGAQLSDWLGSMNFIAYDGAVEVGQLRLAISGDLQFVQTTVPFNRLVITGFPEDASANYVFPTLVFPEICTIFCDGFESGDTTLWDATSPF